MDEKLLSQPMLKTAADYQAAIEQLLTEMKRLNEQMDADRREIDRLKAETETLRAETRSILATLGVTL